MLLSTADESPTPKDITVKVGSIVKVLRFKYTKTRSPSIRYQIDLFCGNYLRWHISVNWFLNSRNCMVVNENNLLYCGFFLKYLFFRE